MNAVTQTLNPELLAIMRQSIVRWCQANPALLADPPSGQASAADTATLFKELHQLGVLHLLFDCTDEEGAGIALVAELAFEFARYSPGLALMVVQQNMASYLLAAANQAEPQGWLALPLFDAVSEWPHRLSLDQSRDQIVLNAQWQGIPLLPAAEALLLPVWDQRGDICQLLYLNLKSTADSKTEPASGLKVSAAGLMLGLRGCVMGDLELTHFEPAPADVMLHGDPARSCLTRLWSQAEVCMMAIRSGIGESTYATARDYAKTRWQGGKYIIEHSLIRKMLADLYQEKCTLYQSWKQIAATLDATALLNEGQLAQALHSSERLPWLCSDGIQLLGGNGYMEDYPQARCFRDAKQCEFLLGHPQARRFELWQRDLAL